MYLCTLLRQHLHISAKMRELSWWVRQQTKSACRAPGAVEGKGAPHPGRVRPSLWLPEPLWPGEGTKRRRNQIRAFVEDPKTGTALNAGPARYRAAGSLSSVDGESTDTPVRGKPSEAGTQLSAIHTQWYLSAAPRPHRSRTELN